MIFKTAHLIPLAILILSLFAHSQVKPLPKIQNANNISKADINKAFANLHQFSEGIYRSQKIGSISKTGFKESEDRWPAGSWGRRYFTWYVDIPTLNNPKSKKKYFRRWYDDKMNWSSHPLIRDTARRVVAYINKYRSGDKQDIYVKRIREGMQYLVAQQKANISGIHYGSFIQWAKRPAKNQPNIDDTMPPNFGIEYCTGLAIRALVEGYFFCEDFGWSRTVHKQEVIKAVKTAANWLMRNTLNYDSGTYNQAPQKIVASSINFRCFSLWGLTSAYHLLQDDRYLNRAFDVYKKNISGYQNPDGAWYYNYGNAEHYHDTAPHYTGIVLRALADLYDILPSDFEVTSKQYLKKQIILTINYFLDKGKGIDPKTKHKGTRLQKDVYILPYYKLYEHEPKKAANLLANELVLGLSYAYHCRDLLNKTDRQKVKKMMNAMLFPIIEKAQSNITISTDVWMNAIAHYANVDGYTYTESTTKLVGYRKTAQSNGFLNNSLQMLSTSASEQTVTLPPVNWDIATSGNFFQNANNAIALYRGNDGSLDIYDPTTSESKMFILGEKQCSLMCTVDTNNDGLDEIVFYKPKGDPDILVFNPRTNAFLHSQSTKSGKPFLQMISGDFDRDSKPEIALYRKGGLLRIFNAEDLRSQQQIKIDVGDYNFMARADYNHDGFDEMVFYRKNDNKVAIYSIDSKKPFTSGNVETTAPFDMLATGDFDNDGRDELAFYRKSDGKKVIYKLGILGGNIRRIAGNKNSAAFLVKEIVAINEALDLLLPIKVK